MQRQILRELSFNRSCDSPHIVRYYTSFLTLDSSSIAICMEYCAGRSLDNVYKQVKSRGGRTGERVLGKIACGVLGGLGYLHERKIIHRGLTFSELADSDIKPSNILITKQGNVKLCDFGVSGELVDSLAGTFTGTSYYMAVTPFQSTTNDSLNG
jgi:mitogen-activated protein kinase kinase